MNDVIAATGAPIGSVEAALRLPGSTLGVTAWQTVDQAQIDAFAQATGDTQWIHVDPLRAAGGPFGGCIAHGLLTLSLAGGAFFHRLVRCDAKLGINCGCDRVRYPAVVRVGARVRGRADVQTAEPIGNDGVQMVVRMTVEIDGESRPGCVADFVVRYHF